MKGLDFIAIGICLLAVVGLYFLLCRFFGVLMGHRLTLALRALEYEDESELLAAFYAAELQHSTRKDTEGTPVVLIEPGVSERMLHALKEAGIPLYEIVRG